MKGILRLVRADDWWLYHFLPLLAATYASIAYFAVPPSVAYPALARLLAYIACIASFAHVVNDIGDIEQDAAAGKPDRWRGMSLGWRATIAVTLLIAGLAVWVGANSSAWIVVLLVAIPALQPIYALRPIRLKERGAWALVTDSVHTHALPTLLCVGVFADVAGVSIWRPFPLLLTAWSFLVGIRGIVYHQRIDEANDTRAGVTTFVTRHGSAAAGAMVRHVFWPAELVALGAVGASLYRTAPTVVIGFVVYGLVMEILRRGHVWRATYDEPAPAVRGAYMPLLAFYRSWPAFAFAILLAAGDRGFIPLLALHTVVFAAPIVAQAENFLVYVLLGLRSGARHIWHRLHATYR